MKAFVLVLLVLASMTAFAAPPPTKIRVGSELILPYTGMTEKGQPTGYVFDILEAVAKKYKYKFEYVEIPSSRQVPSVQKDEIDYCIQPIYIVRYLSNIDIISSPLGVTYAGALTVGKTMESISDLSELAGKTIIMSYMGPETESFRETVVSESSGKKTEIVEVNGSDIAQRMMLMMKSKRADVALGDYYILRYAALKNKAEKAHVIPASFAGFGALVLLSRKNKPGIKQLDKDIAEWFESARRSGRLKKILKKYNLEDWEPLLPY